VTAAIESLPILVLDVYSRCNCRCVMCDIWKRDTAQEIRLEDLERQLPAIKRLGVEWVVFTGGEPLMHSQLFALCAPLKELGIRITLLTTGLLLSRFAGDVAREIDDVIVSLDGPRAVHDRIRRVPGAFERMRRGIEDLHRRKPKLPVSARSTVQRGNAAHLTETVAAARELGCDSISFLAADTDSSAFDHKPEGLVGIASNLALPAQQIEILSAEIERLIDSGECGKFIRESPAKLRRIVEHFRGRSVAPACNAPWVSAVWGSDGSVRPCFFHRPIGSTAPGIELDAVLNAPEALAFRSSLNIAENEICRRCVCSLNTASCTS
jgi:MoaA/NifB/PqqE/SkfB family radical SAM enzyme